MQGQRVRHFHSARRAKGVATAGNHRDSEKLPCNQQHHARANCPGKARRCPQCKKDKQRPAKMTMPVTRIRKPIARKTAESNGVLLFKWEGTPRHCCIPTRNTSPRFARPRVPASNHPRILLFGRKVRNQATDMQVKPKDSPKRVGLRHEVSPSKEPPVTTSTPVWNTALASNKNPAT